MRRAGAAKWLVIFPKDGLRAAVLGGSSWRQFLAGRMSFTNSTAGTISGRLFGLR
jgi:hypothetical protein